PAVAAPLVGAVWLARSNLRAGRGDRRGAWRLAVFILVVQVLVWIFSADRGTAAAEWDRVFGAIGEGLVYAAIIGLLYLALEPHVRKRWPAAMVAWTRILAGRAADPLVGRDLLAGALIGAGSVVLIRLGAALGLASGLALTSPRFVDLTTMSRLSATAGVL